MLLEEFCFVGKRDVLFLDSYRWMFGKGFDFVIVVSVIFR